MNRVVVTSRSFSSGSIDLVGRLREAGLEVVTAAPHHGLEDLRGPLSDAVAWIAGTGPIGQAQLDLAPSLRVIARYGVGYDAVDIDAATARGIVVTNTPGANSDAVADHALALTLAALRAVVEGDRRVRAGDWSAVRGSEVGSATVGVVGFGRIGRGVAARFAGFGSRVLVHDPYVATHVIEADGYAAVGLGELFEQADIVSLHLPGGSVVVDSDLLATVKHGQLLVNTARADLVDEGALAAALRSGAVRAYAADTLVAEGVDSASPLLSADLADRVVVTPHLGAQTVEAIDRMGSLAVDDVLAVLAGRPPAHPVTPINA
jgi:D-3-phosphoglycerate dehydrogenase